MESQPDETCTNESLAASDVAVGGSVDGRNKTTDVSPMAVVAAPTAAEAPKQEEGPTGARSNKHTHFRKRALSTATTGSNNFDNGESLGAISTSGISLLANSLNPNGMVSGGEGSIVSFGLNFNFDSTSSPSNSDSGEGDKGDGKEGSDGENKCVREKKKESVNGAAATGRGIPKKSNGSGGSGSNNKKVKAASDGSPPSASKENSETASDSGQDQDYNSGGSAASGSGNDGSSGGKSTISSLTTSSNQEWMAAQNKEAKKAVTGEGDAKKSEGDANLPKAVTKDGATSSGKKRKKASQGKSDGANDEDSTGGYNTDEEQWGGKINNKGDGGVGNSIVHKQHHVVTATLGNSDPSSLTDSNIVHQSKGAPPLKQARFSLDQTPHPRAVPSAETSAQMALSSLSSDTPMPSAAAAIGRAALPSLTSAAQISSSNPSAQAPTTTTTAPKPRAKRGSSGKHHSATLDPKKREERNAREKERSCRIAKQIDELRSLLSRGGVIVAKGTKSSVLAEAANYINLLQQQQVQWEVDRQAMLNQMQEVGATPSVVQSQGQLPQGMSGMDPNGMLAGQTQQMSNPHIMQGMNGFNAIDPNDYKFIFNNSSVGMAIASMGGAYVDCNDNFCKLSGYSKQEVCSMTIFNMTSRDDLQHAFDLISQMITPNLESPNQDESKSIILRGAMKDRNDLGLSISLIKGSQGIGRCFCVTLVRIISRNTSRPDVISVEMELPFVPSKNSNIGFGVSPAYTAG